MSALACTFAGVAQHLALAVGQGVGLSPGFRRQFRVDHARAGADLADGVGQRGRRRVFQ